MFKFGIDMMGLILVQIENHLFRNPRHRAGLIVAAWTCLGGGIGYFQSIEKVFGMLYKETAMMVFGGGWVTVDMEFKRGLARALIQYSHTMGRYVNGSEGLCSALVMAIYDPWGDATIKKLLKNENVEATLVKEFVYSEPHELLLIRIECLVLANLEEAAIQLLSCSLNSASAFSSDSDQCDNEKDWKWPYMEWLLLLLFRKRKLDDIVKEVSSCSCHDGVRLINRTLESSHEDSEALTETLINVFLVRDLLFKSNYCCTNDLMKLWVEFQAKKHKSNLEIQEEAKKTSYEELQELCMANVIIVLLYNLCFCKALEKFTLVNVMTLFGNSLLSLYLEFYIRGLTSDLNFLEAARQADNKEYVIELENHMAAMYHKLSTLFNVINKEIAFECLMSAFSLEPTSERMELIKKLSFQISKEKAQKSSSATDDSKHKLCNRSGCSHNFIHPTAVKRKSVVMCDQAIQVGDDSFEDSMNASATFNLNVNNQGNCDKLKPQNSMDNSQNINKVLDCVVGKKEPTNVE
ncbi:hypothetical protein CEXT_114191 [Caerostris extrusa]|uniref:Uncharacterized protein n=1 Tax=Caerostris extrusa TaxID=172846 RepID=A0AAV4S237_CAEEX|nr:hypothetical protein CEXT_114191 [Caerostris extrusa]